MGDNLDNSSHREPWCIFTINLRQNEMIEEKKNWEIL